MTIKLNNTAHYQPVYSLLNSKPKNSWKIPLLILWLLGVAIWLSPSAQAADEGINTPKPADVRMVIDVSGSMKRNDPANLRQPAVELLLKLLPQESKAGVWTFGQYINMLVPHKPVDEDWKQSALDSSKDINSVGLFTNIGQALEKASYDFETPNQDYNTSIILLTDGMVDVAKDSASNQKEWRRIVDDVIPRLEQSGFKVHTVALSENADTELMDKLALATGGYSEVADSADDLLKAFLRIFDQAVPTEQVPLTDNNFLVDSSVEEFTALIFRQPGSEPTRLISPDNVEYRFDKERADVQWYHTNEYDLITLQQPLEGEWQVLADMDPDSRVTVVSNLNLLVKPLPANVFVDDTVELSVLFQDQGSTVTDSNFLSLLSIDGTITSSSGDPIWSASLVQTPPPRDGIYSEILDVFQEEGRFEIVVSVDGKSFQRQFKHQLSVREPFSVELSTDTRSNQEIFQVQVFANSQLVVTDKTQVVASIKHPDGRSSIKPLLLTSKDTWELEITPEIEGEYQVFLRINGEDSNGDNFNFSPKMVSFLYPSSDNPFADVTPPSPPTQAATEADSPAEQETEEPLPIEPEPAESEPDSEAQEESSSNWLLYAALGAGNLLLVLLAFLAYRVVMGSGKGDSLKDLEESVTEAEETNTEASPKPELEMQAISEIEPIESDLEGLEMDEGLDLSTDEVAQADISLDSTEATGETESTREDAGGVEEVTNTDEAERDETSADESMDDMGEMDMGDFSLDDFAPEEDSTDDMNDDDFEIDELKDDDKP